MPTLYYIHDPMCSWCYGFSQTFKALSASLPEDITIVRLLGGLAPDTDSPMPGELREKIQSAWEKIEQTIPGVMFNFRFWSDCIPRRSTYPACRAVIAARVQDNKYDLLMTRAIQNAYYQQARNPSDFDVLSTIASELCLDVNKFENDMVSESVNQQLMDEIKRSRALGVDSYPSLVLEDGMSRWHVAIDYTNSETMLETINNLLGR